MRCFQISIKIETTTATNEHCVRHIAEFQLWEKFFPLLNLWSHQICFALNSSELQKNSKFWNHRMFKLEVGRRQTLDSTETKWEQHVNDHVHVVLSSHANNLYPILVLVPPVWIVCVISINIHFISLFDDHRFYLSALDCLFLTQIIGIVLLCTITTALQSTLNWHLPKMMNTIGWQQYLNVFMFRDYLQLF